MAEERMSDAELEQVTGGTGSEIIGLMTRLQDEGLMMVNTPLIMGNEEAAMKELKTYLNGLKGGYGAVVFKGSKFYADNTRANVYKIFGKPATIDQVIESVKNIQGTQGTN